MKVCVIGSSGMLGTQLVRELSLDPKLELVRINRKGPFYWNGDAEDLTTKLKAYLSGLEARIINASGWIPQRAQNNLEVDKKQAFALNKDVPSSLDAFSLEYEIPFLQLLTDCVFDGSSGLYSEQSAFNSNELYGASKIAGEAELTWASRIRSSIIGSDGLFGLFGWFSNLPKGAKVNGYVNHLWNGVTTNAFSRLARAWVRDPESIVGVNHWVPSDFVSKFELLQIFQELLGRADIEITPYESERAIDRRLTTLRPDRNQGLWQMAGYEVVPSIRTLCEEMVGDVE